MNGKMVLKAVIVGAAVYYGTAFIQGQSFYSSAGTTMQSVYAIGGAAVIAGLAMHFA